MTRPFIIGQCLNTSGSRRVAQAVGRRDADVIAAIVQQQVTAGVGWLDVCAAGMGDESDTLQWLVQTVQKTTDVSLSLDTHDSDALRRALPFCRRPALINSVSLPLSEAMGAILRDWAPCSIVALCLDRQVIGVTVEARVETARRLADHLGEAGVLPEHIVFDPLTLPLTNGLEAQRITLQTMTALREHFPASHVLCAVGNFGYGQSAQKRRTVERTYANEALRAGADTLLCDPALFAYLGDAASDIVGEDISDFGQGQ